MGRGIQQLRDAGVRVEVGVEETSCLDLNKRFITSIEKQRPYIVIKVGTNSRWISSAQKQSCQ